MKKSVVTGLATVALALGAFAQGTIDPNNSNTALVAGGVTVDNATTFYSGAYGLEIWELNSSDIPANMPSIATVTPGYAEVAYGNLTPDGFKPEATFTGQSMAAGTVAGLPYVTMADVSPAGATVTIAYAMWNTAATSFSAFEASRGPTGRAGVLAFVNGTQSSSLLPGTTLTGWTENLVMVTAVPEPGTLALAGLGVAALLIFRRRK